MVEAGVIMGMVLKPGMMSANDKMGGGETLTERRIKNPEGSK